MYLCKSMITKKKEKKHQAYNTLCDAGHNAPPPGEIPSFFASPIHTQRKTLPYYNDNAVGATSSASLNMSWGRIICHLSTLLFSCCDFVRQEDTELISQCELHAHNAPYEYISHVPWMLATLESKRKALNNISVNQIKRQTHADLKITEYQLSVR